MLATSTNTGSTSTPPPSSSRHSRHSRPSSWDQRHRHSPAHARKPSRDTREERKYRDKDVYQPHYEKDRMGISTSKNSSKRRSDVPVVDLTQKSDPGSTTSREQKAQESAQDSEPTPEDVANRLLGDDNESEFEEDITKLESSERGGDRSWQTSGESEAMHSEPRGSRSPPPDDDDRRDMEHERVNQPLDDGSL